MKNKIRNCLKTTVSLLLVLVLGITVLPDVSASNAKDKELISELRSWMISTFDSSSTYQLAWSYTNVSHEANENGALCFMGQSSPDPQTPNIVQGALTKPIDVSDAPLSELYLSLEIFIEDPSAPTLGQIELSSSGQSDVEELSFPFKDGKIGQFVLQPGWNSVVLPLDTGTHEGGRFRFDHLNFFRIYFFGSSSIKIKLNDLCIMQIPELDVYEDFRTDGAVAKWNARGATLERTADGVTVTMTDNEALITSDDYAVVVPMPDLYMFSVDLSGLSAAQAASLVIGRQDVTAEYDIPTDADRSYVVSLATPDRTAEGFSDFLDADTVGIRLKAPRGTKITLHNLAVLEESVLVERKIDTIGEITPENYKQKQSLIDQAAPFVDAYLAKVTVNHITKTVQNYYAYVDACARAEFYAHCETMGVLAELIAPEKTPVAGEEIVLDLRLYNVGTADLLNYSYRVTSEGLGASLYSAEEMLFHLQAEQSKSFSIRLCASEGGMHPVTVTLYNDLGEEIGVSVTANVVVGGKGFYKGDSHTHSVGSDGKDAIANNAYSSYQKGSLVFYATDHNSNPEETDDIEQARAVMEAAGYGDMVLLKGNEITSQVLGAGHMLYYGTATYYPAPASSNNEVNKQLFADIMDSVIAEGGTCYIAHPYSPGAPFYGIGESTKNIDVFTNFTGVEIFNDKQTDTLFEQSKKSIEFWDRMNIKGERKYFAIGNSDAHYSSNVNLTQSVFLMSKLSEQAYNNALITGSFYATSGPDLRFTINDTDMGDSIITDGSIGKGTVRVIAYDELSPLTEVRLIKYTVSEDNDAAYNAREVMVLFSDPNGETATYRFEKTLEVQLKAGEFYRLEVTSLKRNNANRMACSNPIWVTTAASDLTLDSTISVEAGEIVKLDIATDNVYDSILISSSDPENIRVYDNGRVEVAQSAQGTYTLTVRNTSESKNKTVTLNVEQTLSDNGEQTVQTKNGSHNVTVDLAGGRADYAPVFKVSDGDTLTALRDPVRAGYRFLGFYQDAQGQTPFDFSTAIVKDTTLYACWEVDGTPQKSGWVVPVGIGALALVALVTAGVVLKRKRK
ncbi:MAG: CehA/McbA family metallohydrolase [Clostridia bacterium]|nr:CehA/McbA family metallohydrolase [Clostridia bacterium]